MDLQDYSTRDLLLTAIKSEEDNYQLYSSLVAGTDDELMSSKLDFLSEQELKHKAMLEGEYKMRFKGETIEVDDIATDVPLPMIDIEPGYHPAGNLLEKVMEAEMVTSDFYSSWKEIVPENDTMKSLLGDLSDWEMTHYEIVKELRNSIKGRDIEKIKLI